MGGPSGDPVDDLKNIGQGLYRVLSNSHLAKGFFAQI